MPLITTDFFAGPYHLAELGNSDTREVVERAISRYEVEYLEITLGKSFAQLFLQGLTQTPIAQRWLDLRSGVEWMFNGQPMLFEGLRNLDTMDSPIAGYVWYKHVADTVQSHTQLGIAKAGTENATIVTPRYKAVQVWNRMAHATSEVVRFLALSVDADGLPVYPEYDWSAGAYRGSLYGGYYAAQPETVKLKNSFGL